MIFCLPGGAGKSWLAPLLALQLGITKIVDPWSANMVITPGALHVTNSLPRTAPVPPGITAIYSI